MSTRIDGNITIDGDALGREYHDPKATARRAKLNELRERGLSIPASVYSDLVNDVPSPSTREWGWYASIWPRPSRSSWTGPDWDFDNVQTAWDTSSSFVAGQDEVRKEREARDAAKQAERDAVTQSERAAELTALTAELKRAYLASPGTSERSFQEALPELLEARARAAALAGDAPIPSPVPRSKMWD